MEVCGKHSTASLMQDMVQIHKICFFVTQLPFSKLGRSSCGAPDFLVSDGVCVCMCVCACVCFWGDQLTS